MEGVLNEVEVQLNHANRQASESPEKPAGPDQGEFTPPPASELT